MTEHQSGGERRQQILASALTLFTTKGFEKTTVDQIADASGLSKGAVYWYFESKLAILFAVADQFVADSVELLKTLVSYQNVSPQAIYLIHRDLYDKRINQQEQCKLFGLLISLAERFPEIKGHISRYDRMWDDTAAELIEGAVKNGYFRPVDSMALAQGINAMYMGLSNRQQLDSSIDVVKILETATRLFYEALIIHEPTSTA